MKYFYHLTFNNGNRYNSPNFSNLEKLLKELNISIMNSNNLKYIFVFKTNQNYENECFFEISPKNFGV